MTMTRFRDQSSFNSLRTAADDASVDPFMTRRSFLQYAAAAIAFFGSGRLTTHAADLPNDDAFRLAPLAEVIDYLGGAPADSDDVVVNAPDLAENGRNVPVSVTTSLSEAQAIYVLAESNPFPFAAAFSLPDGTDASISVRLKLAQSGEVIGVVRAANKLFWASKHVQVTVGGCA